MSKNNVDSIKREYMRIEGDIEDEKDKKISPSGNSQQIYIPTSWLRRIAKSFGHTLDDFIHAEEVRLYWVRPQDGGFKDSKIVISFLMEEE